MSLKVMDRIRCEELKKKIMSAEEAADMIKDRMTVAVSGFTPSGNPKAIPLEISRQVREGKRKLRLTLLSGASTGPEIDNDWAELGIIERRFPYITSKAMRDALNGRSGPVRAEEIAYMDQHLGMMAQNTRYGFYGGIDFAVIEAAAITEEGDIVPSTAVGCAQTFIKMADRVIIEVNTVQPEGLEGMHDIYDVSDPPFRKPIPLESVSQRIGRPYLKCPKEKIAAIVISDCREHPRALTVPDENSRRIARHIVDFLEKEAENGRISADRVPLQSGVGSVANAVLSGLVQSRFDGLTFYSEVIQDGVLDLIDTGQAVFASGTSLSLSEEGMQRLKDKFDFYKDRIVLRDSEISNSGEVIRRLGVIAMNTAIEADIYGNVNSSHMNGTDIYNGIGGSGDFARNAALTIFITNSVAKEGRVSSIVPMVTHVDHAGHDVDVIVTEQGYTDLRGKSPKERARLIIDRCAHPAYRFQLNEYFEEACRTCRGAQTPHILEKCFEFHLHYRRFGTMLNTQPSGTNE